MCIHEDVDVPHCSVNFSQDAKGTKKKQTDMCQFFLEHEPLTVLLQRAVHHSLLSTLGVPWKLI